MLSCYSNAGCDVAAKDDYGPTCGSTVGAVIFFCSFIFLCMFLVSSHSNVVCLACVAGWRTREGGMGNLSNDDDDGGENVSLKVKSRCFKMVMN